MKLTRLLTALIAVLIVIAVVAGCGGNAPPVGDPDKALKDAHALVTKAASEKSSAARDKDYQEAIQKFNAVAAQYKDKPQGAKALFELGNLYQSAKGKTKNLMQAYTELTTLLNKFDRSREELSGRGYLPAEIDNVLSIVKDAKVQRNRVAAEQNKINSKQKLLGIVNLYVVMDFLVKLTGSIPAFSYWFAIIIVTLIVKLLITPLTKMQFKAMKEMQKISPLVKEIQAKHKGDQKVIGEKTMDLYKEHHINPFASCLPMLVQMPILLMLYYMIRSYQFQFENGTFLWIGSSLKHLWDVTVPFGGGGTVWVTAGNLAEPDLILVLLYVVSMYVSTKLSNVDPTQAEQQKMMSIMMPIMFAFLFAGFPSAFLLYWLVFNVIQTVQQYLILHTGNEPVPASGPAPAPEKPKDDTQRPRRRRRR